MTSTNVSESVNVARCGINIFRLVALGAAMYCINTAAIASAIAFHDWSPAFTQSSYTFSNTSSAGTISGVSLKPGFESYIGTFGVPFAIAPSPDNIFTSEFQIHGTTALGATVDFNFSNGYKWGTGGQLILGNIHNYYEYTLSAWGFGGNSIDVNLWSLVAEYDSTAVGTQGYFSTSNTSRSASGNSSKFFVNDSGAGANFGQGGVLLLGNTGQVAGVGRIQLSLTASNLGQNDQLGDFILFNVGTPVPEPTSLILVSTALFCLRRFRSRQYIAQSRKVDA